eukprot:COSAG05_NODE_880_length_6791_cov_5.464734_5_plen_192_part_00
MEFGESVTRGLASLGELDDASFQTVIEAAAQAAMEQDVSGLMDGLSIDGSKSKPALQGLTTLLLEAAKFDAGASEVSDALGEVGLPSSRSSAIVSVLNGHQDAIRANLMKITFSNPKILDVQWRVDHSVRTKYQDQIGEPTFLITIITSGSGDGGARGETSFACSKEELQSLVSKLKDACTQVDRILGTSR